MQSALDNVHTWFFEAATFKGVLEIVLLEGIMSNTPESVKIAGVEIGPAYPVGVPKDHRKAHIIFEHVLAYQIVDESYTGGNSGNTRCEDDNGKIAVYEKSCFLTQVTKNGIIPLTVDAPVRDYCIWSEDYVIDVVSTVEPRVELESE